MNHDQNSYNKSGMITFTLSMIASFGILIYVAFFGDIDLKELPQEAPAVQESAAPVEGEAPAEAAPEAAPADAQAPAPDVVAPDVSPTPEAAN